MYLQLRVGAAVNSTCRTGTYCFATTASWGSVGSAAARRAERDRRTVFIVKAGLHWSLRISDKMLRKKNDGESWFEKSVSIAKQNNEGAVLKHVKMCACVYT
jgi:hypothetical protein